MFAPRTTQKQGQINPTSSAAGRRQKACQLISTPAPLKCMGLLPCWKSLTCVNAWRTGLTWKRRGTDFPETLCSAAAVGKVPGSAQGQEMTGSSSLSFGAPPLHTKAHRKTRKAVKTNMHFGKCQYLHKPFPYHTRFSSVEGSPSSSPLQSLLPCSC